MNLVEIQETLEKEAESNMDSATETETGEPKPIVRTVSTDVLCDQLKALIANIEMFLARVGWVGWEDDNP